MKTKYFKHVALSEDTKKSINKLAALPKDFLEQILTWFDDNKTYPRFDKNEIEDVAQMTSGSGEEVTEALWTIRLFIDRIIDNDDNSSDFYSDIKSLGIVEEKVGYGGLDVVFSRLPGLVANFRLFRRKKLTEGYGGPTLIGSSMTAAIKPVFLHEFEYGKDLINKYEPSPTDYCVVAQIALQKSNTEDLFSFQLSRNDLDRFITSLLALQAEVVQMVKEADKIRLSSQIGE